MIASSYISAEFIVKMNAIPQTRDVGIDVSLPNWYTSKLVLKESFEGVISS
jgi:hypothetical protein